MSPQASKAALLPVNLFLTHALLGTYTGTTAHTTCSSVRPEVKGEGSLCVLEC